MLKKLKESFEYLKTINFERTSKRKVEVFLEEEEIEFLKSLSSSRSEAIRKCVLFAIQFESSTIGDIENADI